MSPLAGRSARRRIGRLLLACVSFRGPDRSVARALSSASPQDLRTFADLARSHGVAPLVHQRLGLLDGLSEEMRTTLSIDRAVSQARHLHTLRTVGDLAGTLQVPFLVVKGPALALGWYDDPTVRSYGDLDLLVRRKDFGAALAAMGRGGYTELATNWSGFHAHQVAEVPLGSGATCVDLHWDLVALGAVRRTIRIPVEQLFRRSRMISLGATPVLTLSPTDTLLHLCVGTGLDGARRLRQLVDVDRVARDPELDWGQFLALSRRANAHALAYAVLLRASRVLATPVPEGVLPGLAPFRGWSLAVGRHMRTDIRLAAGVGPGLLVSSGRATPAATARAALDATREAVRVRTGQPGLTDPGGALDWQLRRPRARQQREAYLDWVGAERA